MGILRVLNSKGDDSTAWDIKDHVKTDVARQKFDNRRMEGYLAFQTTPTTAPNRPGVQLDAFNPDAEEIILVPRLVGG